MTRALAALAARTLTGCATIVHGPRQDLTFHSTPPGATVLVDGQSTTTPGTLSVRRKLGRSPNRDVRFTLDGYQDETATLEAGISGWFWGNLLMLSVLGAIIDSATGSILTLSPETLDITMTPLTAIKAPRQR